MDIVTKLPNLKIRLLSANRFESTVWYLMTLYCVVAWSGRVSLCNGHTV